MASRHCVYAMATREICVASPLMDAVNEFRRREETEMTFFQRPVANADVPLKIQIFPNQLLRML